MTATIGKRSRLAQRGLRILPAAGYICSGHIPALRLLGPSYLNHASKMGFEFVYWNMLLPGRPLPFSADMKMDGKIVPEAAV